MPRVFGSLAVSNLILLLLTAALGMFEPGGRNDRHVLLAVLALLFSCAVQVFAFTSLTVTGKVIAQAVHLRRIDPEVLHQAKRLKRSLARWLALVILSVVLAVATGATALRGFGLTYHWFSAILAFGTHGAAMFAQYDLIVRNARLLHEALPIAPSTQVERVSSREGP